MGIAEGLLIRLTKLGAYYIPSIEEAAAAWRFKKSVKEAFSAWDAGQKKSFWNSLTGDREHKISACITKMDGKVDDPGAFCGALAREVGYEPEK
jgi:hypothetical protein